MQGRAVLAVSLFFTGLMITAVGTSIAAPGGSSVGTSSRNMTAAEYSPDAAECAFVVLINQYRNDNGLGPLTLLRTLGAAADHKSEDMAARDYFDHTAPALPGGSPVAYSQNIANHGYTGSTTGENILYGWSSSMSYDLGAQAAFDQWKASPPHNENMLRASFNALGIGRATVTRTSYDPDRKFWYWTTTFGGTVTGEVVQCDGVPNATATNTRTATRTATVTRTPSNTPTRTATNTRTPTTEATATRTPTKTATSVATATRTPTKTRTPTRTATTANTNTPTRTPTKTKTPSNSATATKTRTPTKVATATKTRTPTKVATATKTRTPTKVPTATKTRTPSKTVVPTQTTRPTRTPRS